jgi:hypothetical protein
MINLIMWLSRYWLGGIITLVFIDWMNHLTAKKSLNERFNNGERMMVFLLWPLMLSVWIFTFIKNIYTRGK